MTIRTTIQGFDEFASRLTPNLIETQAAINHRESILDCLKNNFTYPAMFRTGSFGTGTSISGYSDVDYFAVIKEDELWENSSTTLREIKEILIKRFPSTYIYVDSPSVVLSFGTDDWENTEITPAVYKSGESGKRIYEIPDCSQSWMKSSPKIHNSYVREVDEKFNGKVKKLIRFIKAWKYFNNVQISSFYLELFITRYANSQDSISYPYDISYILNRLHNNQLSMIQDPKEISGYISPCKTNTQKDDALSKLETAKIRAEKALLCYKENNYEDAFFWWNRLYNGEFPAYKY